MESVLARVREQLVSEVDAFNALHKKALDRLANGKVGMWANRGLEQLVAAEARAQWATNCLESLAATTDETEDRDLRVLYSDLIANRAQLRSGALSSLAGIQGIRSSTTLAEMTACESFFTDFITYLGAHI